MSRFRLQTVLDHRQRLEGQGRQELAAALEREAELCCRCEEGQQELHRLYDDLEHRRRDGMHPQEMVLYERQIGLQVARLAELAEALDLARTRVEAARASLVEASRERRLLEKLEEKHLHQEKLQLQRREAVALDEIALQFHKR